MNDAEFETQKARIEGYVNKWYGSMGLGWYRTDNVWVRDSMGSQRGTGVMHTAASVVAAWQYRKADITWNLDVIEAMNDAETEMLVVHELVHILLAPTIAMSDRKVTEKDEFATECVSRALMWVREDGKKYAPVEGEY